MLYGDQHLVRSHTTGREIMYFLNYSIGIPIMTMSGAMNALA